MRNLKRLWILLGAVVGISFSVLLFFGGEIYRQAPPIPEQVVIEGSGVVLFTAAPIR